MMKLRLRVSVLIWICASVVAAQTKTQETAPTPPASQTASRQGLATVTETKVPTPPATETRVAESKVPVAGHRVRSTKEVKNLYIEPMVNDLDKSLLAEFSRQLAGRVVIVSKPEDA